MHFTRSYYKQSVAFIAALFLFSACTKIDTTNLGSGLIPPIDGVITKDTTLEVETSMRWFDDGDTITTIKADIHGLGQVNNDPVMGDVNAELNLQIKPAVFPFHFNAPSKDSLVLDSIVLGVAWYSTWGNTTENIGVEVREITSQDFRWDSVYRNNAQFATGSLLNYAATSVSPKAYTNIDTLEKYNEVVNNQLRIRLNQELGNRFLKLFDTLKQTANDPFDSAFASNTGFDKAFRGFNIRTTSGNAIMNLLLNDENTKLAIYYRRLYGTSTKQDTTVTYFRFHNVLSASSNYVKRTPNPAVKQAIDDTLTADPIVYMWASPYSPYTQITIPGLKNIPNAIVHRAELVMDQVPGDPTTDGYFTPPNLFLGAYSKDSARIIGVPGDAEFSGQGLTNMAAFGGFPVKNYSSSVPNQYLFNFTLSRYVQGIITSKDSSFKLILMAPYMRRIYPFETAILTVPVSPTAFNYPGVGRVRLYGGGSAAMQPKRMRLRIIYSVI